jgi:adenylate cyclase
MREQTLGDVHPAVLADHLTRGGAPAEAIPIWAMAGQQAAARAAHKEAAGYLRTALDLLRAAPRDPASVGVELQLLIGLAVSLGAARGYHDAQTGSVLAEARAICDALGNTEQLFMVFRALNAFSVMGGNLDRAEDFARRCVEIADASGRVEHLLQSESALGYVLFTRGDMAPARTHLERAVTLYEENDGASMPQLLPNDALIQAFGPLLMVLFAMDDDAGASKIQKRLIDHARAVGGSFGLVTAQLWRSLFFFINGDFDLAIEAAEEVIGLCDEFEYPAFRPSAAMNRAFSIAHLGEAEVGLRQAREALAELDRLRQKHPRAAYLSQLADLELLAGDAEGALATVAASIQMAEGIGEAYWLSPSHRLRAEILAKFPNSDPSDARAALAAALDVARRQGASRFVREAEAAIARGA